MEGGQINDLKLRFWQSVYRFILPDNPILIIAFNKTNITNGVADLTEQNAI